MLLASRNSRLVKCIPRRISQRYRNLSISSIEGSTVPNYSANTPFNAHSKSTIVKPVSFAQKWPEWNIVVGIETHVQLKTSRKLFSRTVVTEEVNAEPNEQVSLFDAAFPGTLPSLNPVCIALATRTALALHADIQTRSAFDRKHYFYGDLPAGYQITQNYAPFAKDGYLVLPSSRKQIRIKQVQIEQDTAKSTADGGGTSYDLNRAGMPLLEIVSQPDISSAEDAGEYVRALQATLRSIGVSDGMMEAGSLRCDVNVSIHRKGEGFGTRTEIKNLNSVKSVMLAINAEATRQADILAAGTFGRTINQQTLTFDEDTLLTRPLRTKEGIEDYRYMPDPNLPILRLDRAFIGRIEQEMRALRMTGPGASTSNVEYGSQGIKKRLQSLLGIEEQDVGAPDGTMGLKGKSSLVRDLDVLMSLDAGKTVGWDGAIAPGAVSFFEEVVGWEPLEASGKQVPKRDPRIVLNWMIHELIGQLTFRHRNFSQNSLSAQQLGDIVDAIEQGTITSTGGKTLLRHVLDATQSVPKSLPSMAQEDAISFTGSAPSEESSASGHISIPTLIRELGLSKSSSSGELERWCSQAIEELPNEAEKVRLGKKNVLMSLVGRVMKLSRGSADAVQAKALLEVLLSASHESR